MASPLEMFSIGQQIGQAVARRRFNKGVEELEGEYGVTGGQGLDPTKSAEYESRVRDLARSSGATRRGMLDDVEYLKQFRDQEQLNASRRIGQQAAADPNNPAALYTNYGMDQLQRGNLPGGAAALQQGRDITRTMGAVGPNGQVDTAALARGGAQSAAEKGDNAGTQQFAEQATKAADMNYGRALTIAQSGGKLGGMDEVLGWLNEGLKTDPRWGSGIELRRDSQGKTWVTRGGEAVGTGLDDNEVTQYLLQLTRDPSGLGQQLRDLAAQETSDTRKAERDIQDYGTKAIIDIFAKDPAIGQNAERLTTSAKALEDAGWKLNGTPQAAADGSTTQMATIGNRLVQIKQLPGDAEDPMAGKIQIIDATTNAPLRPDEMQAIAGPAQNYMSAAASVAQSNVEASIKDRIFRARSIQQLISGQGLPMMDSEGGDPIQNGVQRILKLETNGDPTAKNPLSSAQGLGQFIDDTWLRIAPQITDTKGMSREQILALKTNPQLAVAATQAYARENANALEKAGLPVSGETIYLAHHFGPEGARALMSVPEETPVSQVLTPEVLAANPSYKKLTVGQLFDKFDERAGATPQSGGALAGTPTKAAAAKPAAAKKAPESALAREGKQVAAQGSNLTKAREQFQQAQAALQKFEQDFKPQESSTLVDPRVPATTKTNLSPEQSQAYAALKRDVELAQKRMQDLTRSTKARTQALSRSVTQERGRKIASEYRPRGGVGGSP